MRHDDAPMSSKWIVVIGLAALLTPLLLLSTAAPVKPVPPK